MPLYDYECVNPYCNNIFESVQYIEDIAINCPKCGATANRTFSMTNFTTFKPFICNDLGSQPIEITSFKHLETECKKRGVEYEIGPTRYTKRERPREKLKKKVESMRNAFN